MNGTLTGISSMATRELLAELAVEWRAAKGTELRFESVGGVDAARRVAAGETFDLVALASDAIDTLMAAGHVVAGTRHDLVRSTVSVAVAAGAPHPQIDTEDALKNAVLAAPSIGYSTGPSGNALLKLFERWGVIDQVRPKLVQAQPGIPVGRMLAEGRAALGFQQKSELVNVAGIDVLGDMPASCAIVTIFSAGLCANARQPQAARAALAFLISPETAAAKRRHGMEPL